MRVNDLPLPIQFPVCMIAGQSYTAKYGIGSAAKLERMGVDPEKLAEAIIAAREEHQTINIIFKLAAATLGNFEGNKWVSIGMTPMELEEFVPDEEFGAMSAAVLASIKKVPPAPEAVTPPTPAENPGVNGVPN